MTSVQSMGRLFLVAAAGIVALFGTMAGTATAVPMAFDLTGVNFSGLKAHVVFGYTPGTGTLSIDVANTSLPSAGSDPRLTGFAFNAPSTVTGFSSFTGPDDWGGSFDPNSINTPGQFGKFDVAGLTGQNFGGGHPSSGISVGSTFHFQFVLTGSSLDALNETSFLDLLSYDPPRRPDEAEQYFIARFQRVGDYGGGSDVAIPTGSPVPVPEPVTAVPEPATLLLLGSGLAGLGWFGRKRLGHNTQDRDS